MKKMYLTSLLLVLCLIGCKKTESTTVATENNAKFDMAAAKTAIDAENQIFVKAINRCDSMAVANCYTADAKLMQPNAKAVEGRDNIKKLFGQWMKSGLPSMTLTTAGVWGNDSLLTAEVEYCFADKDGKVLDQGKALELFKKEDGRWKLYRDCYNSDMPAKK